MNRMLHPLAVLQAQTLPYLGGTMCILLLSLWVLMDPALANSGQGMPMALKGGALCALATAAGAVPVLLIRRLPQALGDALLGFGAGVMLAATAFSLVLPGLEAAVASGYSKWGAGALVSAGVILGALALLVLGRVVSDEPLDTPHGAPALVPSRVLVFVLAIMLHNVPEGMAVGVAAAAGIAGAESLAMGIALQDIPEGMVVALILAAAGMSRAKAVFMGAFTGVVEPAASVGSAWALGISSPLLPWGLAFAGGAMLMAVGNSLIPESNRNGNGAVASIGLVIGFCVMMVLDTALG